MEGNFALRLESDIIELTLQMIGCNAWWKGALWNVLTLYILI